MSGEFEKLLESYDPVDLEYRTKMSPQCERCEYYSWYYCKKINCPMDARDFCDFCKCREE